MTTTLTPKSQGNRAGMTVSGLAEVPIPYDIQLYGECPMRVGDKTVMQFYLERIAEGAEPRFAELLALQSPPGIGITTSVFLQDQRRWGSSIADQYKGQPRELDALRKGLARNGYKLKSDDQYISTAARFPNDPAAIVNETQGFDEVQRRVSEQQKRAADAGPMKVKHKLHPRIVNRIMERKIEHNPDLKRADKSKLRAEIIEKHGSKGDTV